MRYFFRKLAFIHRRLWAKDEYYRAGMLFGPPPLIGALLGAVVWMAVQNVDTVTSALPPWAVKPPSQDWDSSEGPISDAVPVRPLPQLGPDGSLAGYEQGWEATIHPMTAGPSFDADVKQEIIAFFDGIGPNLDMETVLAKGPKSGLYAGVDQGFLAIKKPGIYALSLRFTRVSASPAHCLTRLAFAHRRIVSSVELNILEDMDKTYRAPKFDLKSGLYSIGMVLGCWHDEHVLVPGKITLMISHPGNADLKPASASDVVRMMKKAE